MSRIGTRFFHLYSHAPTYIRASWGLNLADVGNRRENITRPTIANCRRTRVIDHHVRNLSLCRAAPANLLQQILLASNSQRKYRNAEKKHDVWWARVYGQLSVYRSGAFSSQKLQIKQRRCCAVRRFDISNAVAPDCFSNRRAEAEGSKWFHARRTMRGCVEFNANFSGNTSVSRAFLPRKLRNVPVYPADR